MRPHKISDSMILEKVFALVLSSRAVLLLEYKYKNKLKSGFLEENQTSGSAKHLLKITCVFNAPA